MGKNSKQEKLYNFFTSPEYYRETRTRLDATAKLDEIQRNEEEYHKRVWNRRKEIIDRWFELDNKNNQLITDITQKD